MEKFSDQLRRLVRESPVSRYQIAKDTGIAESTLSVFIRGERGLSIESIDKLYEYLGLKPLERKGP